MRYFDQALTFAKEIAPRLKDRSFVLVMGHYAGNEDEDREYVSDFTLAPRDVLPCWGELRKYSYSHDDCTQPDDYRPTDLYQPFPSGKPEALVVGLQNFSASLVAIEDLLTDSPWGEELKKGTVVEISSDCLVFRATDVQKGLGFDPTVLVSFLAFLSGLSNTWMEFRKYLSIRETCLLMMSQTILPKHGLSWEDDYYFSNRSAYRILEGKPHLLSGGTFGDRVDYSRQRLQDVFGTEPSLAVYVNELAFTGKEKEDLELFCKKFKEHLQVHYDREKEALFSENKEVAA